MRAPSGTDLGLGHPVNVSRDLRIRNLFSSGRTRFQIPLPGAVGVMVTSTPITTTTVTFGGPRR
jgi:hypothetical protein